MGNFDKALKTQENNNVNNYYHQIKKDNSKKILVKKKFLLILLIQIIKIILHYSKTIKTKNDISFKEIQILSENITFWIFIISLI